MREYACFLWKRMLKRKSNLLILLVCVGFLATILVLNYNMRSEFRYKLESKIETLDNAVRQNTNMLSEVSKDSDEYEIYQGTIQLNETFKKDYEALISLYDIAAWDLFYEKYLNVLEAESQIIKTSIGDTNTNSFDQLSNANRNQIAYIGYLYEHELAYENPDYPIFALSFITSISRVILPILVFICCVYMIAQLFTIDNFDHIDISGIFPIARRKKELTKLILGICICISIYLLMLLTMFLLSFFLTFHTGLEYPILIQEGISDWSTVGLLVLFPKWFILGIVFYLCTCVSTYLVSKIIKEETPLFFSMLCVSISLAYLPSIAGMLMPIAHYLPTTYLKFVDVVSGTLANTYGNAQITCSSGMLVLSIFLLLELMAIGFLNRKKR